jgi:hypothetical protein
MSSGDADFDAIADRGGTPYRIAKPSSLDALTKLVERALRRRRRPGPIVG